MKKCIEVESKDKRIKELESLTSDLKKYASTDGGATDEVK